MADQAPPTLAEIMAALAVLIDGVLAVGEGTWNHDMQAERDQARGVINRARAAGVL